MRPCVVGPNHNSYLVEAFAIREMLERIPHVFGHLEEGETVYIFTDSWSALSALESQGPINARDYIVHEICNEIVRNVKCNIVFCFVYGHTDPEFTMQEEVDQLANRASHQEAPAHVPEKYLPQARHRAKATINQNQKKAIAHLQRGLKRYSIRRRFANQSEGETDRVTWLERYALPSSYSLVSCARMGMSTVAGCTKHEVEPCLFCDESLEHEAIGARSRDGSVLSCLLELTTSFL